MSTILLVILVLLLIGALPTWPYSRGWGYYPSGGLGLVVLILLVLALSGRLWELRNQVDTQKEGLDSYTTVAHKGASQSHELPNFPYARIASRREKFMGAFCCR